MDTDVELKKNLDFLLSHECYFAIQQEGKYINTGLGFGAIPRHDAVKLMLKQYEKVVFDIDNKDNIACPYLNSNALIPYGFELNGKLQRVYNTYIYPPSFFDPYAPGDNKNLMNTETISIHHYSATWTSKKNQIKRKIIRMIGQEKISKIKMWIK